MRRKRLLAAGLSALALASVGGHFAAAALGCGATYRAKPQKTINPKGRAPIVIGDSVMGFAVKPLGQRGFRANAMECRQWYQGIAMIQSLKARHRLPHLVVLALGSNGPVTSTGIHAALHALPKNKVLGLVTPRGPVSGGGTGAMRTAAKHHKHRIVLLDWVKYSAGHSSWFAGDGLHLNYAGAAAYARLIAKASPWAKSGKFPHGARFPR
jgi:hypothetical protein